MCIRDRVDISKVDASGEQEVEGAQLTLYGPDKTEIDSWTSSDKPHRVEHLAPGTYSLREMKMCIRDSVRNESDFPAVAG